MIVIEVENKAFPTPDERAAVEERCRQFMHETFNELGVPEESREKYIWSDWWPRRWAHTWFRDGEEAARAEADGDVRQNVRRVDEERKARELMEGASERVSGDRKKYAPQRVLGHVERLIAAGGGLPLSKETAEKIEVYLNRKMTEIHDKSERADLADELVDECFDKWEIPDSDRRRWQWDWGYVSLRESVASKLAKGSVAEVRAALDERVGEVKSRIENEGEARRLIQSAADRGEVSLMAGRGSHRISTTVRGMVDSGGGVPLSKETAEKIEGYLDHEVWRIQSRDERKTRARELTAAALERVEDRATWNYGAEKEVYKMLGGWGVTREDMEGYLDQEVVKANTRHEREMSVAATIEAARASWGIPVEHTKGNDGNLTHAWWELTTRLTRQWEAAEERGSSMEDINTMARAYLDKEMEVISDSLLIDKLAEESIGASPLPEKDRPSEWQITSDARKVAETMRDFFELVPAARNTYDKGAVLRTWINEKVAGYAEIALRNQLVAQAYDKYRIPPSLRPHHDDTVKQAAKRVAGRVERFFVCVPGGRALYDRSEIIAEVLDREVRDIARVLSVAPGAPSVDKIRERVEQELEYRREHIDFVSDARRMVARVLHAFRVPTDTWGVDNPAADPRRQALDKIAEAVLPACKKIYFDLWKKDGGRYLKEEKKVGALCEQLAEKIHTEVDWDLRVGRYAPQKAIQNPERSKSLGQRRPQTFSMER